MTGNSNPENVVNGQEGQSQPSPVVSTPQSTPTSGQQEGAFVFKSKEDFIQAVQEIVTPTVQSVKDRRIARMENDISDVKERLAGVSRYKELLSGGYTEKEALLQMQLDAVSSQATPQTTQVQATTVPNQQTAGSQSGSASAEQAILEVLGISQNDPGYLQAVASNNLGNFIKNKLRPAPSGVVSQPSGGQIASQSNQEAVADIQQKLHEEMNRQGQKDHKRIKELNAQLKEAMRS